MNSLKLFCIAFLLGFSTCAALVYYYQRDSLSATDGADSFAQRADSTMNSSAIPPTLPQNISQPNHSPIAAAQQKNNAADVAKNNVSEAEYWLAQLRQLQKTGSTEDVIQALLNYSHYELDANKLNSVIDEFKIAWLHDVNQFLNSAERLDIQQINGLERQRFIDRLEQLLFALPGDAELHWLLSRLYRLAEDQYQAEYHAILAASDPRFSSLAREKTAVDEPAVTEETKPVQGPLIIPLQRLQNHFLVKVHISGQPALLLLDTGASLTGVTQIFANSNASILTEARPILLDTAGGSAKGSLFTAKTVELGGLVFRDHPTVVYPVMDNQSFDGVLGLDILGRFDFYIDQPRAELRLKYWIQ